jgi:HPt (histidine-containing phosphotransfer) domain-containing protein
MDILSPPVAAAPALAEVGRVRIYESAPEGGRIDHAHLERMTMGNRLLAREVLALFRSQTTQCLARLKANPDAADRRMVAHTILGSARGVGAWDVAARAHDLETAARLGADMDPALAALDRALADAHAAIDPLLLPA